MPKSHQGILGEVYEQYKVVLDNSNQAMYIFLNDDAKLCNGKFAKMLGYETPAEWAKVQASFTAAFVDEKSQHTLVHAYQHAMQEAVASVIPVTWKTKDGRKVQTQVIIVPIAYKGELMALHFVAKN